MIRDAIGLDIGGANLKAATASGQAVSVPFELWRQPERLAEQLTVIRDRWPNIENIAVTMTGELCDCFPTKRDGVRHILAAVRSVFGLTALVWTTAEVLTQLDKVVEQDPLSAAAANWLGLATFVGRMAPTGLAFLIDTGSTTTDVIPLLDGKPMPTRRTDAERMRSGELIYTGIRRTPVCALRIPDIAAEWFATTADAYVYLGRLPEEPNNSATADGRPLTREFARARLSRMLGGDPEVTSEGDTMALAKNVYAHQKALIVRRIDRVVAHWEQFPATVIQAGSGEFLVRDAWETFTEQYGDSAMVISLADRLGVGLSEAACAYALAVLAVEAKAWD